MESARHCAPRGGRGARLGCVRASWSGDAGARGGLSAEMVGLRYSRRTSPVRFAHPHFAVRQFHNGDATESDQRSNWSRTTALSPIKFLHPKSLDDRFHETCIMEPKGSSINN